MLRRHLFIDNLKICTKRYFTCSSSLLNVKISWLASDPSIMSVRWQQLYRDGFMFQFIF